MLHDRDLRQFAADAFAIDARLRARLTRWELAALAFTAGLAGIFAWAYAQQQVLPFDYHNYIKAAQGDLLQHYYADWILPLYWLLERLPPLWGYLIWNLASIMCVFLAARVFGGNAALALVSYQMLYVMYLGQITGLLIGGLALLWWGLAHRRWMLAGLGLLIAGTKFQTGAALGGLLWLFADVPWRERLRALLLPAAVLTVMTLMNPSWFGDLLGRIEAYPPIDWASISLWQWIGPAALLFWLPPLLFTLPRERRFLALAATCPLALPYFQQADLLALFVLPVGWLLPLLGNLGYLFLAFGYPALQMLWIIPLVMYVLLVGSPAIEWIRRLWSERTLPRTNR
jgi:hypothetical protein